MNQYGATVCVRSTARGVSLGCRVIDTGGVAQGPYDLHFAAAAPGALEATVSFTNGRRLNKTLVSAFGGLQPTSLRGGVWLLRDTPVIASVSLSPTTGPIGIGGSIVVSFTALWREAGLRPSARTCCLINGVNVSDSFVDAGNGSYSVKYRVSRGGSDVRGPPAITLAVSDAAFPAVVSDSVTASQLSLSYADLVIDVTPPQVSFTCVDWNNTVRGANSETVCMSCGLQSNETLYGCQIFYLVGGTTSVVLATPTGATTAVATVTSSDGDRRMVTFWSIDAAGNTGSNTTLVWTVDSATPITLWPTQLLNLTSSNALELSFGCTKVNCHFQYSFDSLPFTLLSHANQSSSVIATSDSLVDTTASLATLRLSASPVAVVAFAVLTRGNASAAFNSSLASIGNGTRLQIRLDGDAAWSDVQTITSTLSSRAVTYNGSTGTLTWSSLIDGVHTIEAQAVDPLLGRDATPSTTALLVVRTPPVVTLLRKPAALGPTPATTAVFTLRSSSPLPTTYQYNISVLSSATAMWLTTAASSRAIVTVSGLAPGTGYRADFWGVDSVGNVGPSVSWQWSSAPCPDAALVNTSLALGEVAASVVALGERVFQWQPLPNVDAVTVDGVQYSLDGAAWIVLPSWSDGALSGYLVLGNLTLVGCYRLAEAFGLH